MCTIGLADKERQGMAKEREKQEVQTAGHLFNFHCVLNSTMGLSLHSDPMGRTISVILNNTNMRGNK